MSKFETPNFFLIEKNNDDVIFLVSVLVSDESVSTTAQQNTVNLCF